MEQKIRPNVFNSLRNREDFYSDIRSFEDYEVYYLVCWDEEWLLDSLLHHCSQWWQSFSITRQSTVINHTLKKVFNFCLEKEFEKLDINAEWKESYNYNMCIIYKLI